MKEQQHPGTITFADLARGTSDEVPVSDVPEDKRFVYLHDGLAVADHSQATERVPVVLVEMVALDDKGQLVATPETAATLRITEFGPGRRALRHTTMVASPPTTQPTT